MKKIFFILLAFVITNTSHAQLFGTYNVPSTYTSIASAISDLNAQGTLGPVTIAIAAGYTETAPVGGFSLYATGTAASPISFQKTGTGANPLITAYTGGSGTPGTLVQDGIFRIIGADYITIDGIDLYDPNTSNPQTMEFGYGLFKINGIDGAQYNTIRNCNITLNRLNNATGSGPAAEGSRGIDVVNATVNAHNVSLTVFSPGGSNSNNKFYSNVIQNCNIGISLSGFADVNPYAFADTNNDIGGSSQSTGNSILNFGGGGTTNASSGIRTLAQYGLNVAFNLINNNTGAGINHATTLRGIIINAAAGANLTVNENTITVSGGGTTSQVTAIENNAGSTAANNTITINNNSIINSNYASSVSGSFYGIMNSGAPSYLNISGNSFAGNSTAAASGATYLIYNNGAVGSAISILNNNLRFIYNGSAPYTGSLYGIYNTASAISGTLNINGNSFSDFHFVNSTGSGTVYFIYNTADVTSFSLQNNMWNGLTLNHSASEYFMYNTSSTQALLTVCNNNISNHTRSAAAGSLYGYYATATTPGTAVHTFSGNIISNINAPIQGTGTFYGIYNTEGNTSPYPRKTVFSNSVTGVNMNGTGTFYGIYMTDLGDGGTTSGSSVYNNVVSNITFSDIMYGLYTSTPVSPNYAANVYQNTINNLTSNGATSTVYGSYLGSNLAGINYYRNKIYNITANGATGTAHGLYGIATTTSNIYNNLIGRIFTPASGGANRANGIFLNAGTNVNVFYNTVYLDAVSTGANFSSNAFYSSTTPVINVRNNIFINNSVPTGTGISTAFRRSAAALTNYSTSSNNNIFYAGTPGPANVIFHNGTTAYQTLTAFQTAVAPRETASQTQNISFLSLNGSSPNFLHITPNVASVAESGAVNITGITTDYDLEFREGNTGYIGTGTAPDIGADEFELNTAPCTIADAGTVVPSQITICAGQTTSFVSSGYSPGTGVTHQWKFATSSSGPYSNVSGGSGANTPEYMSGALTSGTLYFALETTCANITSTAVSNQATVIVNPIPSAVAAATSTLLCGGQTINLNGTGNSGSSYNWTGPNGYSSSAQNNSITNITGASAGIYSLVTTLNNCSSPAATVAVAVSEVTATIIASQSALCFGNSTTLTVNTSANTYSWSNSATTQSISVTPLSTTVYSVVVTNTANCTATRQITISVTNPTITATGATVCGPNNNASLTVNAFPNSVVSWYSSPTSTVPVGSGNTFTLNVPVTTTVYAQAVSLSTGSLFTTLVGGNSFLGNMFDVTALNSIDVNGFDIHVSASIVYTVEVWYRAGTFVGFTTSNTGWILAGTATVTGAGTGNLTLVPMNFSVPVAVGQTVGFYVTITSGSFNYTNAGAVGSVWAANNDVQILVGHGGGYFNQTNASRAFNGVMRYSKSGCSSPVIPVTLTVAPIPTVSATSNSGIVCAGLPTTLTATGADTYSWTSVASGSNVIVTPQSTMIYTVTGTTLAGCKGEATVQVATHPVIPVVITQTANSVCPSQPTTFTASGSATYTWSTGPNGSVITVTPALNTTYTVFGTNNFGCAGSQTVAVATKSVPLISIVKSKELVCAGEPVTITANGATSYTWLPGNIVSNSISVNPVVTAVFNAIGVSVNACTNIAFAQIVVDPCTSINTENLLASGIKIFPNPTTGKMNIDFDSESERLIEIFDLNGKRVFQQVSSEQSLMMNVESLSNGIYMLRIKSTEASFTTRIVIQE